MILTVYNFKKPPYCCWTNFYMKKKIHTVLKGNQLVILKKKHNDCFIVFTVFFHGQYVVIVQQHERDWNSTGAGHHHFSFEVFLVLRQHSAQLNHLKSVLIKPDPVTDMHKLGVGLVDYSKCWHADTFGLLCDERPEDLVFHKHHLSCTGTKHSPK